MRGHVMRNCRVVVPVALIAAFLTLSATAQTPGAFAGKTVTMYIGFGPGGGYDLWARVIARHIGAHLPGHPTVTPENFQGAGSYRAANFIYNVAPKDGTAMAAIARDAVLGPLTGAPGAQFDATKFSWLGTPAIETNVCIAYHTADVKTVDDLTKKQLVVGDNGPGTGTHSYPLALNAILGTKFKIVGGYPSSADVFLAMERGEVQGICESLDSIKKSPAGLDCERHHLAAVPGRHQAGSGAERRAVRRRSRATAGRQAGDRIPLCRPRHRPSIHRAARPAGGPAEDGAGRLRRDHEGSRFHRRNHRYANSRSIRPTASSSRRWSRRPMPRRNRSSTGSRN